MLQNYIGTQSPVYFISPSPGLFWHLPTFGISHWIFYYYPTIGFGSVKWSLFYCTQFFRKISGKQNETGFIPCWIIKVLWTMTIRLLRLVVTFITQKLLLSPKPTQGMWTPTKEYSCGRQLALWPHYFIVIPKLLRRKAKECPAIIVISQ